MNEQHIPLLRTQVRPYLHSLTIHRRIDIYWRSTDNNEKMSRTTSLIHAETTVSTTAAAAAAAVAMRVELCFITMADTICSSCWAVNRLQPTSAEFNIFMNYYAALPIHSSITYCSRSVRHNVILPVILCAVNEKICEQHVGLLQGC